MTPQEIKQKVEGAYAKALSSSFLHSGRDSNLSELFRDVRLYGRKAGVDFVQTHLDWFVREAVGAAECQRASLEITMAHDCGQAAIMGMVDALGELTGLEVEAKRPSMTISWAGQAILDRK